MRTKAIFSVAVLGALSCASLLAQVYSGYSGPNTIYWNRPLPSGYSLLIYEIADSSQTNKGLNSVADIIQPPNYGSPQNGFTVFTTDENGFKSDNYLNGWTEPQMALLPGNCWFIKNPYALQYTNKTIADGINQSPTNFTVHRSTPPLASGGLASAVFCPATEGDFIRVLAFVGSNSFDPNRYSDYKFTNNHWLPGIPSIGVDQSFLVYQRGIPPLYTNEIWENIHLRVGQVTNENQFVPVGTPVGFSTNLPGYIASAVVSIPFVVGGESVCVQLRAWQLADGPSFEAASARSAPVGISSTMTLTAHARTEGWNRGTFYGKVYPGNPPSDVNNFPSFQLAVRAAAPSLSPKPSDSK